MKKTFIRRALALAGAASLGLFCAAPAFAAQTEWEYLQQVRLASNVNSGVGRASTTISGPAVTGDSLVLERGGEYDVVFESTFSVPTTNMTYASWLILGRTDLLYAGGVNGGREGQQAAEFEEFLILEKSGESITVAKPTPGSTGTLRAECTGLGLADDACIEAGESPSEVQPDLHGEVTAELRCTVEAVASLPLPRTEKIDGEWQFENQKQADAYIQQVQQALDDPAAQLAQPQEAVLKMTYRGDIPAYTTSAWNGGSRLDCRIAWPGAGSKNRMSAVWQLGEETYTVKGLEDTPLRLAVSVVPKADGAVSTGIPVREESGTVQRAAAVSAGAAALGLSGGAVLNGLSSALENTPFARRREDFDGNGVPENTPDLSGADTPSVSMSFYRPFDDLMNTRGAAVDIQLSISGGEGLRWHYLPAAVCPGGLKAVIPAVAGSSSEATLVLNLTGAKMKKAHVAVFITVVAWAFADDGRLVKTTGNLELALHRPGLEAKRTADGGLEVVLYADGNLDGVAEKVTLKPGQYTLRTEKDGALLVEAKRPYRGSCRLAPDGEE